MNNYCVILLFYFHQASWCNTGFVKYASFRNALPTMQLLDTAEWNAGLCYLKHFVIVISDIWSGFERGWFVHLVCGFTGCRYIWRNFCYGALQSDSGATWWMYYSLYSSYPYTVDWVIWPVKTVLKMTLQCVESDVKPPLTHSLLLLGDTVVIQ